MQPARAGIESAAELHSEYGRAVTASYRCPRVVASNSSTVENQESWKLGLLDQAEQ